MMARCRYDKSERRVIAIVLAVAAMVGGALAVAMCRGQEPRQTVVLYFTQPNCGVCVQQKPNWEAFKRQNQQVHIEEVDTSRQPNTTRTWKVATTPTTLVISSDESGQSIERARFRGVVSPQAIRGALP
jgi:thioredoxin-like negative regulator of GroEL